jgi:opacity protein-like surface antigen
VRVNQGDAGRSIALQLPACELTSTFTKDGAQPLVINNPRARKTDRFGRDCHHWITVACALTDIDRCALTVTRDNQGAKHPILGAGAAALVLFFSATHAQAQCAAAGFSSPLPAWSSTAGAAVAGVSTSVSALVSSIHTTNTAFLAQSSAFIGSPANPQPDQQGGGMWARGVGGHMTSSSTATAGNIVFGAPVAGTMTCNTRTVENFAGVQVGTDVARLNVNGWNFHAGPTVGYMGLKTQDATPAGLNPSPSFRDNLKVPFVGLYAATTKGGFFVDGQVRWDFFQNEVSDNNHGLLGQRLDARGIALTGNVGYIYDLGNHWFVEPSAGIVWSRTAVDSVNVPGTMVTGTGSVPPWVLSVDDIQSTLGRLSVRVGTSVIAGNTLLQPFASASVFHEFHGGATSSLTSNFAAIGMPLPTLTSTVSTASLGTYGQFGLGVAAQFLSTGWLSYLRGDYRTGDDIEGLSLNGGLRYQFVPDPVAKGRGPMIAKAPLRKAPAARTAYDWTGFYIGAHVGTVWGFTNWRFDGEATDPRYAGAFAGAEIGYNYQIGKWVLGVEADTGWSDAHGARPCPQGFFFNCEMDLNWLSTATARVGYAYWDRLLVYAKGGAAIAQDRANFGCSTGSQPTTVPLIGCPSQSDSRTKAGWTVGWGSEFGLTPYVSVKGETAYFDLGTTRYNMDGIGADIQRHGFISTVGFRFRFGAGSTRPQSS